MHRTEFEKNLEPYLPPGSLPYVMLFIEDFALHLKITKERTTKHGDYRAPMTKNMPHRISINGNLNPVSFLLTLLHEIAHMHNFEFSGRSTKPHGKEWKQIFSKLAEPFFDKNLWPENLAPILEDYFKNPKASTHGHAGLFRALKKLDGQEYILLEDLLGDARFYLPNGEPFIKGEKRRTRFVCTNLRTKRKYLINGLASVTPIPN